MARVTVEDCLDKVDNRFQLVLLGSKRARQLARHPDDAKLLSDVAGATPCNAARKLVDGSNSKLIAGVNLPMLLRCVTYRNESLAKLVVLALAGGQQGVVEVVPMSEQNQV